MRTQPPPDDLAIVILNWNAADDTLRRVREIVRWQHLHPTLWIVDNASTDDSVERIRKHFPDLHLICNEANLGFAGGNNRGIRAALAEGDHPVMLLNNDASVAESDVLRLLATLRGDARIGFVGPLLLDGRGERVLAAGGRNPILHHLSHLEAPPCEDAVCTVEYVPGTVLLARAEVFRTVGLLDERYFFSMEVADLCMRASRVGYRSVIDRRARAYHALEARPSALRQTLYVYYIIRNRYLFVRNFYPRGRLLLIPAWTAYGLALWLKLRMRGQRAAARAVWMGLVDGLRGRFGGQNRRLLDAVRSV